MERTRERPPPSGKEQGGSGRPAAAEGQDSGEPADRPAPAVRGAAVDDGVRAFSERWLPTRGWRRVLLAAGDEAPESRFLARRGYDVTSLEGRARTPRGAFDAAVLLDPPASGEARAALRLAARALRRGGLLLVGGRFPAPSLGRLAAARLGLVRLAERPGGMAAYRRLAR